MKCKRFRPRNRVTVQSRSETSDSFGGQTVSWGTLATVWAEIEPLSGREVFANQALDSRVSSKMTIRYRSDLKDTSGAAKNRISFDGRIFTIHYVRNLHSDLKTEGRAYQQLFCEDNGPENV